MIARILYYSNVRVVNNPPQKENTPRSRAYDVEQMEYIDHMCAPKGIRINYVLNF
jgi:hypothetical protein